MKILRVLAVSALISIATYVLLANFGWPSYLRTRYHHWRNADGMTALADALLARQSEFDWIAKIEGEIEAGSARRRLFRVDLDEKTRIQFRTLFESANTYYLNSSQNDQGGVAFLEVANGRRATEGYQVALLYKSLPRENRAPCQDGYFSGDIGNCFVSLDENWVYELSWLDENYKFSDPEE